MRSVEEILNMIREINRKNRP